MGNARQIKLLVTLGDMAGIGPEVVLKALPVVQQTAQLTLVGNEQQLMACSKRLGLPLADHPIIDVPLAADQTIRIGQGDAVSGDLSFRSLQTAIGYCLKDGYSGVITAPIAKSAWLAAGHHYPGQTELLAEMAEVTRFGMLFVARSPMTDWTMRTLLATTHIPLRQVPEVLTPEVLTLKLELLLKCLERDFGVENPKVAIAGLNPHSGEQGQIGREEIDWLIPWLNSQRQRFPHVTLEGPVPPDTLWVSPAKAWHHLEQQAHHGYLALYHDQGLIPVKMLAFDQAVNTTIGLPFIRTSPDHGTAFDIAGQGIARPDSMVAAIDLAIELAVQRQVNGHN
ncbi:4-hydroxythreonine-4-phosphate dehydrogenase PdxA [Leptothoe sp. ISB3NOV94-8A]|nr:4-hydroxythreonine-4-phosphate dehydrogenase PdxA [Leptothoe sp. LEGE 181152]